MQWLFRPLMTFWTGLFGDKRSEYEKQRERSFIDAANKLKTLAVTERGGMSIDPEEIRDQIIESREALKHLVAPSHRRPLGAQQEPKSETKTVNESDAGDYVQVITWRRLPSKAAIRYVCLQSMNENKFAIAATDYFSGEDHLSHPSPLDHRISQRFMTLERVEPLVWFDSLKEAMDVHDAVS